MEKILVVNNDMDTMTLLKTWLEKKKYKVKYTGNEEEVSHLMKNFNPKVVIVDVLQDKVIEKLKTDEKTAEVPILLMTGYVKRDQDISKVNVDDVIEKPFDLSLLERKIEALLAR